MLNDQQMKYLEAYCVSKGVVDYDVQAEIIDHVAEELDMLRTENPLLSFKEALEVTDRKFVKNDFKNMFKSREQLLKKEISKSIEQLFVSFFKFPQVVMTIALYVLAFSVAPLMHLSAIAGIFCMVLAATPWFYYVIANRQRLNEWDENRKNNLLSFKVRSKYEKIVLISALGLNLLVNVVRPVLDIHTNKDFLVSMLLLFAVTVEILYLAVLHVRLTLSDKMKIDFPKAFIL